MYIEHFNVTFIHGQHVNVYCSLTITHGLFFPFLGVPGVTCCPLILCCSFLGIKQHFDALTVLFTAVTWVFSIILVSSISWLVWEFDSQVVPITFIGL